MPANDASAALTDRLVATVSQVGSALTSPGLYRVLLRLLASGQPVAIARLAAAVGHPADEVQRTVAGWPDTEYDEQGRIVGYGLTLRPTPHRFIADGKQLYTWCALDTLFFPAVIGRAAHVESPCAATGVLVRLIVDPAVGVIALDPATAVVSIVTPEQVSSVRADFCNPGRFFASHDAACDWQRKHPGMTVVAVSDAYQAGRSLSDALLDDGVSRACCTF
ncbi:MAG TPA: organomercurial lyase MerB [Acetobacteraceae bacterium]|nr:organomercurial lyase MerB [Acetobacteraceae bacterium]